MDVAELREHAAECVRMAQTCSTDRERLAFLAPELDAPVPATALRTLETTM